MSRHRHTATHVHHDKIAVLIGFPQLFRRPPGHALLVEGMEKALAFKGGMAGNAGHRLQLVHRHRVDKIRRHPIAPGELITDEHPQIGGVLSHGRIVHIVHRPLIDLIGARRDVAQKASSSHHSGKIRHTVAGLLHFLQDQLQTVAGLLIHMMERSQILLAVQQRASPFLLLFLEYGQLGGGGPGIDDQNVHMLTSCSVLRNIVLILYF